MSQKHQPIKRSKVLQPLSRDHHHGLLFCWKLRTGFSKNINIGRIKSYSDWFFQNNLKKHFRLEEDFVFPVLGKDHELIKKAISEHKKLEDLFTAEIDIPDSLRLIEEMLENHIRFEERVLFNEVEKVATPDQMNMINEIHHEINEPEVWKDEFWKAK